jgi:hypothetical protein
VLGFGLTVTGLKEAAVTVKATVCFRRLASDRVGRVETPSLPNPLIFKENRTAWGSVKLEDGGYGWTRTTDPSIMSAVL